jgi:NitT/TauT family transport system permease protein
MIGALSRSRQARQQVMDTALLIGAFAIIWQLAYEMVGATGLAPPIETVQRAYALLVSADFWPNVYATFRALGIALVIEIVAGLLIGLLLGLNRLAAETFEPMVISLYSIPKIMFYPVILMVFGIGLAAEVAFGIFHGIVPIILFTLNAVRNTKPIFFRTARALRLSPVQTMWSIAIPAAIPEIFSGLRIGFAGTVIGVLLSEMFGSRSGLGFMLMNAIALNIVGLIMALTLVLVVFAAAINGVLLMIDNRLHRRL